MGFVLGGQRLLHAHRHQREGAAVEGRKLQLLQLFGQLPGSRPQPLQQIAQQFGLEKGQMLLHRLLQAPHGQHPVPFLFQLCLDPPDALQQFRHLHRFQQIILRFVQNGFPGILEIGIPRQQDAFRLRPAGFDFGDEFQTVHPRHADVRDDDVDGAYLQQGQRFVRGISAVHLADAFGGPVDGGGQALDHMGFVIHDEQSDHSSPLPRRNSCPHCGSRPGSP